MTSTIPTTGLSYSVHTKKDTSKEQYIRELTSTSIICHVINIFVVLGLILFIIVTIENFQDMTIIPNSIREFGNSKYRTLRDGARAFTIPTYVGEFFEKNGTRLISYIRESGAISKIRKYVSDKL